MEIEFSSIYDPIVSALERSKSNTERILDEFWEIFFVINEKGAIFKSNSYGASLFQLSNEEIVDRNISEIFTPEGFHQFTFFLSKLITMQELSSLDGLSDPLEFQLPLEESHSKPRTIFWTLKPLAHVTQDQKLFSVIGRDISASLVLEESNRQLEFQNNRIQAILNSASQGFLTYNQELKIEKDHSQRAKHLLGSELVGKFAYEVLNFNRTAFSELSQVMFLGSSWDLLKNFAKLESEVNGRILRTELVPIIEEHGVKRILAAVTDITELTQLQKTAELTAQINKTMVKILQSKALFLNVVRSINRVDPLLVGPTELKRWVHTWKGEFSFFECHKFVGICQKWETTWKVHSDLAGFPGFLKEIKAAIETFLDQYDDILKIRGTKEQEILVNLDRVKSLVKKAISLNTPVELLSLMDHLLESPISDHLSWLNEVWLTTGERLGKKLNPILWQVNTFLFAEPYKDLLASLVHSVRNSADHGIEYPQDRIAAGKAKEGSLFLRFELKDGVYFLSLRDDGRGIKLDKVQEVARQKGILLPPSGDVLDLLFQDDFTTNEVVTEYSGMGVGLSVIRTEAVKLGGWTTVRNLPSGGVEVLVVFKKKSLTEIFASQI